MRALHRGLSWKTVLKTPIALDSVQFKVHLDGTVSLPAPFALSLLDTAGQWLLVPHTELKDTLGAVSRDYKVVIQEETISYARGSVPTGEEGEPGELVRINAVTNALKDLGALRELADPVKAKELVAKIAQDGLCENTATGEVRRIYWPKGEAIPSPWKEYVRPQPSSNFRRPSLKVSSDAPSLTNQNSVEPSVAFGGNGGGGFSPGLFDPPTPSSSVTGDATMAGMAPPMGGHSHGGGGMGMGGGYAAAGSFDIASPVPPIFKKLAGKTWLEVISEPSGRSYLHWAAEKFTGDLQAQCKMALNIAREKGLYGSEQATRAKRTPTLPMIETNPPE